jgi:hypothetical protein
MDFGERKADVPETVHEILRPRAKVRTDRQKKEFPASSSSGRRQGSRAFAPKPYGAQPGPRLTLLVEVWRRVRSTAGLRHSPGPAHAGRRRGRPRAWCQMVSGDRWRVTLTSDAGAISAAAHGCLQGRRRWVVTNCQDLGLSSTSRGAPHLCATDQAGARAHPAPSSCCRPQGVVLKCEKR